MKEQEFLEMISVSGNKFITVSRDIVKGCPNLVRVISIFRPADVIIEFNTYGFDEGGLRIRLVYDSFDNLVESLECFLNKQSYKWIPYNDKKFYPELSVGGDDSITYEEIINSITRGAFPLPENWTKKIFLSSVLNSKALGLDT